MAHSYKSSSGKASFGVFSEPQNASEYIHNKKLRTAYCNATNCNFGKKSIPKSELLLIKRSQKKTILNSYENALNNPNLNINLITKLDLLNVPVIRDFSTNDVPTIINNEEGKLFPDIYPYLEYDLDPCGNLFGDTICGINGYVDYLVYNPPPHQQP